MKRVNDFLSHDCFVIKDTNRNCEVLGLQINIWGETELSDKYGRREVIEHRMESGRDIWGELALNGEEKTLVLYI